MCIYIYILYKRIHHTPIPPRRFSRCQNVLFISTDNAASNWLARLASLATIEDNTPSARRKNLTISGGCGSVLAVVGADDSSGSYARYERQQT